MSHYIRVISLTVKEGTKLLRTNPVFLPRRLNKNNSIPNGSEERGEKGTGRHQNNALNAGYCN